MARPRRTTRMSTAGAALPRTTSSRGIRISPPTAPPAQERRPQFRLFLHAGAYWLMWGLRAAMPKRSSFAVAQFDTLRLRLIKIAARVVEMKPRSACTCRHPVPTSASCASSSIASLNSRHNDGAQTPRNEPVDRNLQTPAFHHDGSPPAPTQLVKKNRNGDQITTSGRQTFSAVHSPARCNPPTSSRL
ncbi:transposase [Mesorhizobium sp. M0767]|uniref:transposase n=1 Tax=unclassified Mesorhizobium TaxID=325217 RepID=UPI0033351F4E